MNTQTEAERLADGLAVLATWRDDSNGTLEQSAAELRRLSEAKAELLKILDEFEYSHQGLIKRYPEESKVNAAIAKHGSNT